MKIETDITGRHSWSTAYNEVGEDLVTYTSRIPDVANVKLTSTTIAPNGVKTVSVQQNAVPVFTITYDSNDKILQSVTYKIDQFNRVEEITK